MASFLDTLSTDEVEHIGLEFETVSSLQVDCSDKQKIYKKCTFKGSINLRGKFGFLQFIDCKFLGEEDQISRIENSYGQGDLFLVGCSFFVAIVLKGKGKFLKINQSRFHSLLDLTGYECYSIDLYNSILDGNGRPNGFISKLLLPIKLGRTASLKDYRIEELLCSDLTSYDLEVQNCEILEIPHTQLFEHKWSFDNSQLGLVDLQFKSSGNVRFTNGCTIECIQLQLSNSSKAFFNDVTISKKADFKKVDFSNVRFEFVDLWDAKLVLTGADLEVAKFVGIRWPKKYLLSPDFTNIAWLGIRFDEFSKKNLTKVKIQEILQERECYRMLKNLSLKDNNFIDGLAFYKNEMKVYWNYIRLSKSVSRSDRFLLFLNRYTSAFGQEFILPIILMFAVHFILFSLMFGIQFSLPSWDVFLYNSGEFLKLINPLRRVNESLTGGDVYLDFLMRISSGFFFYHIVRAFRKYSRKY